MVVTRTAKAGSHDDERDEEFMADALTIVSVQTIFRLDLAFRKYKLHFNLVDH